MSDNKPKKGDLIIRMELVGDSGSFMISNIIPADIQERSGKFGVCIRVEDMYASLKLSEKQGGIKP